MWAAFLFIGVSEKSERRVLFAVIFDKLIDY